MKKMIDTDTLAAIADDIDHSCTMLGYADEDSAEDDIGFYVPRIRRTVYNLRKIIREAEPEEGV